MALDRVAARRIDAELNFRTDSRSVSAVDEMEESVAGLLGVDEAPEISGAGDFAGVANLAAHFGVKRRDVENDSGFVFDGDDFLDSSIGLEFVEADEFR